MGSRACERAYAALKLPVSAGTELKNTSLVQTNHGEIPTSELDLSIPTHSYVLCSLMPFQVFIK